MKRIYFVMLLGLVATISHASVNTYTFASSSATYTAISGGVVLGSTANDDQVFNNNTSGQSPPQTNTGFSIGFSFLYNGVVYDKFAVNSNGWILLGTGSFTIAGSYTPISASGPSGFVSAISALGMDLQGQAGSELSYLTSGTAPNRVLTVQWTGYRNYNQSGDSYDFQINLFETSNQVSFTYGTFTKNSVARISQVGLRGFTNADFHNRTTSTNWGATTQGATNTATCSLSVSVLPPAGLTFLFNPLLAVPGCAGVIYPPDLAGNIMITALLTWSAPMSGGSPTGYKLYFGTDFPPSNIVNGTLLGLVTTYDPSPDMNFLTTYYWKIVPVNGQGDAVSCVVWSFTTGPDPTIQVFPHCESFDSITFEPYGWLNMKTIGSGLPGKWDRQTSGSNPVCSPHSGAAMARYNSFNLPQGTAGILVTPPVNFPNDHYKVTFWMYRDDGYPTYLDSLNVYFNISPIVSGATLMGTVNRVRTLSPPENANGWYHYGFNLPVGGGGAGRYIIFEAVSMYGNNIFIDDVCLLASLFEFGDAPDPTYPTLLASGGACHVQSPFFMGALKDYEPDGQPDAASMGDDINLPGLPDDEDGVVFGSFLVPGQQAQVTVTVNMPGFLLQGWIDFNADGDWADPGEQIFIDQLMPVQVMTFSFLVPPGSSVGNTYTRFRYSSLPGLGYSGTAPDGEVEDYQVYLGMPPTGFIVDPDLAKLRVQNEISMALLPGTQPGIPSTLLAAYNDHPYPGGPGLGVSTSSDGGITWLAQQLPYPPDPFSGGFFVDAFDPTATADAIGNLYVAHISTDYNWATGPASGLFVNRSSDGGNTWNGPYVVAVDAPGTSVPDPNFRFNDRCQITADVSPASPFMNNLYLVEIKDRGWQMSVPTSDIYFTSSNNQGSSWTPQVIINGPQSNLANMPVPAVAPDGTIYVSWLDYNVQTGGTGTIYLDKSLNGGNTWLVNDILVQTIILPPLNLNGGTDVLAKGAPVIHTSPFNSMEVYITYAEQNPLTSDEADIMFIRSTDGGLTWSVPIRVNDDLTFNDQVMPWMDVKPNGTIDIAWYDRRNDPADLKWDVFMSTSTDGGLTFGVNQQVNTILSAPSPSTPSGSWMGEYLGLVVDQNYAYVAYASSFSDIKGDIYFDKFENPVTAKTLNLKLYLEGLYAGAGLMNKAQDQFGDHFPGNIADEVVVELHDAATYATVYYTVANVSLTTGGNISVSNIPGTFNANYYVSVKHRNSIETTTAAPLSFAGSTISYDFTTMASMAYGSNQQLTADGNYVFWGGDVNQDGIVDGSDMNYVDNAVTAITFGYVPEDVNGDGIVDGTDMNMVDNNSTAIIMAILPP